MAGGDLLADPELEQLLLGGAQSECDAARDAVLELGPGGFYDPRHQAIAESIGRVVAAGQTLSCVTVAADLADRGLGPWRVAAVYAFDAFLPSDERHVDFARRRLALLAGMRRLRAGLAAAWSALIDQELELEDRIDAAERVIPAVAAAREALGAMRGARGAS